MDAVLGLSVTPSAVGLVLVQGQDADGATMDGAEFEVDAMALSGALQTSEQAAAAVLRTEAIAAGQGHRVQSIGVTWSDEADAEASLLLKSLSDSGFDNVIPVRLSEATDALARGIAAVAGYRTTAVCVIEPEQLIALVVQTDEGAVQTAVNHSVVTEEDLVGWLSAVFTKADWQPEALVLVGSAEDLDGLLPVLEEALSVPVFSPAQAQLALARGAALACAHNDFDFGDALRNSDADGDAYTDTAEPTTTRQGLRRLIPMGPAAMLAAGLVTFVAAASAALALQAAPERAAPQARAAAETPAAVRVPAPLRPTAPTPEAAPAQAPGATPVPALPEADPAPRAEPFARDATMANKILPQPDPAAAVPPEGVPLEPIDATLPPVPELEDAPLQEPTGMMQRIRDRFTATGDDQQPPGAPPLP